MGALQGRHPHRLVLVAAAAAAAWMQVVCWGHSGVVVVMVQLCGETVCVCVMVLAA